MTTTNIPELFNAAKSFFIYHPDLNQTAVDNLAYEDPSKTIKTLSKLDVQYLYDTKYFSLSDLHIAKVVAKHVFVTQSMVKRYIDYCYKMTSAKEYMPVINDVDALKLRLQILAKAGILTRYAFDTYHYEYEDKLLKMSYYLVSPHGYNYLRRILDYKEPYDEYLAITPIEEVFKCLAVNSVCLSFLKIEAFRDYNLDFPFYIKEFKSKEKIYGVVDVVSDNINRKVIIEPFKLTYNKMRISEETFKLELNKRFKILKEYIGYLQSKGYTNNDIIFVCEDFDGIKKAGKMANHYLPEYMETIYFTTDVMANQFRPSLAYVKIKNKTLVNEAPDYIMRRPLE